MVKGFLIFILLSATASAKLTFPVPLTTALGGTGDSSPWYISAALDGGNPSLGVAAVSSYTELTSTTLTLRPVSGSVAVGVMCSTTNAATAPSTSTTTCAAGSESVGINFTIPDANSAYEVCFYSSHFISADINEALTAAFQLIETPTNAQTLTLQSGNIILSAFAPGAATAGANATVTHPLSICSIFKWASAGTKGIRVMYEQTVTGTPNNSLMLGDLDGSTGQRNMSWTVKKVH